MNNKSPNPFGHDCGSCVHSAVSNITGKGRIRVALAGNPNTGKSTIFNALTGLKQHTGNWPGKTVQSATGTAYYKETRFQFVDLPGTYSLLSNSEDEQVARDYLLFENPDVTVVVADASRLERHLNLLLQIMQITPNVVLCLNLIDEAQRHGVDVDAKLLSRELGIPVVKTSARSKKGLDRLLESVNLIAEGKWNIQDLPQIRMSEGPQIAISTLIERLRMLDPDLPSAQWIAMRLLEGDGVVFQALLSGKFSSRISDPHAQTLSLWINELKDQVESSFRDTLVSAFYSRSTELVKKCVKASTSFSLSLFDIRLDNLVTHRLWGFPIMFLLLATVLWLTITGANYPSQWLSHLLLDIGLPLLKSFFVNLGTPAELSGFLVDGVYQSTAWVVSVMLPPMAIFFPLFTLLEDFGYLPRVAFNLDRLFKGAGAHGKQALTLSMGFGCNAAGVVSTRIINSPREKLLAIITNNFSLCNGRWPTQILIATIFLGVLVPPAWSSTVAMLGVIAIAILGIAFTFFTSWLLSLTLLKGKASFFTLELPPYRPPQLWQTLYTSLIDRTLVVLWRAVVFAAPAGAVIWLISNIMVHDQTVAVWIVEWLNPFGLFIGLNGVILLAYIVAIPANEIVIPTILMLTVLVLGTPALGAGSGVLFEADQLVISNLLQAAGWTTLTGINLMLFSLLHNPCSTTIYTIYKETGSVKWTSIATILPIIYGIIVCAAVAFLWKL
ncbi:ferrous iron transport protein B [Planobacterium oryzisoli]|uniref:Ferrous iron transport protein B n=1 Tax=Planobacterium oryzisoli TaxID=2771435 RepID=A0A931E6I6_9FLAO|nr:ferrous iron transport protein B [Planobacterium oryzisoli]MBF5026646.1 ferrous iron transport protein B [Planobacterium oryzisoli]